MKILMVGDVIGKGGRRVVSTLLPRLIEELSLDFVCIQGENVAGGFGITRKTAEELIGSGADVITSGNHIWDNKDIIPHMSDEGLPLLRPLNYPSHSPGRGAIDLGSVVVVNLIGRTFMGQSDCPFASIDGLLKDGFGRGKPIIVDIHAEASSEKQALGWHLDGRVSAICGTHTHTPTADAKILPKGTAFVTDLGMVGAVDSVVGMHKEESLDRFIMGFSERFHPVLSGLMQFNSVLLEIDDSTSKAIKIRRIDRWLEI